MSAHGRGLTEWWNEQVVLDAVNEVHGWQLTQQVVATTAIDCRCFADPSAGMLRDHCGMHPIIIGKVVEHPEFPRVLRLIKARTFSAALPADAVRGLVLACRGGKHRSVAMAYILMTVMDRDPSVHVIQPPTFLTHLERACRCHVCHECRGDSSARLASLSRVLDIWMSIQL